MDALTEIFAVDQVPGEPHRRWFTSSRMDLIVWLDESERSNAFQLCYDKPHAERALTWKPELGFRHAAIDDGEVEALRYKATPILVPDGDFASERIGTMFDQASSTLPLDVAEFVGARLRAYPAHANGT